MIKIIAMGNLKEKYLKDGVLEYSKRIKGYDQLEIIELKEVTNLTIEQSLEKESELILSKISKDDYVITLEIEGKMLDSVELSKHLENLKTYGNSKIVFIIGSSNGLADSVKKRSNYKLSFSKMTLPHQLMRLVLLEQIYRSQTIQIGKEYHK